MSRKRPGSRARGHGGTLALVLGDQLDAGNPALAGHDPTRDGVLFVEAPGEAAQVWSHKARIAAFFSAMRHRAQALAQAGSAVDYRRIGTHPFATLADAWTAAIQAQRPDRVRCCEPGDWRVLAELQDLCQRLGVPLEILPDAHFLCSREAFGHWAGDASSLRLEFFYRWMRRRERVLMDGDAPAGGRWNFDADNRKAFGRGGPKDVPVVPAFAPDAITREVLDDVERHFAGHPGSLAGFDWPVTPEDAQASLEAFVRDRLPGFGPHQDAIVHRPVRITTRLGVFAALCHALAPKVTQVLLNTAFNMFPDSAAARHHREGEPEPLTAEQIAFAQFTRGIHW